MPHYFYKSEAPEVVASVVAHEQAKTDMKKRLEEAGALFGGTIAMMRDVDSNFAGGVKLPESQELNIHWCRPDDHGYRKLRSKAVLPKGLAKEQRAAIREEHERLVNLWQANVPKRLNGTYYWEQLSINTGNLWLCGGIKFALNNVAYFCLGFEINQADYEAKTAANQPSSGWITGAVEILPSEYETARKAKLAA